LGGGGPARIEIIVNLSGDEGKKVASAHIHVCRGYTGPGPCKSNAKVEFQLAGMSGGDAERLRRHRYGGTCRLKFSQNSAKNLEGKKKISPKEPVTGIHVLEDKKEGETRLHGVQTLKRWRPTIRRKTNKCQQRYLTN